MFIDTHLHCWDRRLFHYEWLDGTSLPERFTPADVADRSGDCAGAVFVESDRSPAEGPAESAWASQLSEDGPLIKAVVAFLPIERGHEVVSDIDALRGIDKVTGVRRLLQDESDEFFDVPALAAGLTAAGEAGLTFDACVRARQLPALVRLRRRAPEGVLVLDHLGKPPIDDEWGSRSTTRWLADLSELAREPNTLIKLSGLVSAADPADSYGRAHPFVSAALEVFGPGRCTVGSDWPVSRRDGDRYGTWFRFVAASFGMTDAEQEHVLWRTAATTYRVEVA